MPNDLSHAQTANDLLAFLDSRKVCISGDGFEIDPGKDGWHLFRWKGDDTESEDFPTLREAIAHVQMMGDQFPVKDDPRDDLKSLDDLYHVSR